MLHKHLFAHFQIPPNSKELKKGIEVVFYKKEQEDYISLTDIAKVRDKENPSQIISLWLITYSTIEYLGLWEPLNNPNFKPFIYEGFKNESAKSHVWLSPQKKSCFYK